MRIFLEGVHASPVMRWMSSEVDNSMSMRFDTGTTPDLFMGPVNTPTRSGLSITLRSCSGVFIRSRDVYSDHINQSVVNVFHRIVCAYAHQRDDRYRDCRDCRIFGVPQSASAGTATLPGNPRGERVVEIIRVHILLAAARAPRTPNRCSVSLKGCFYGQRATLAPQNL